MTSSRSALPNSRPNFGTDGAGARSQRNSTVVPPLAGQGAAPATGSPYIPKDHWEGLRQVDVKQNGLFELLKTADERLSPLLSALGGKGAPPEPRPMAPAPQIVPPLPQQVAEFLASRRRPGGTRDVN